MAQFRATHLWLACLAVTLAASSGCSIKKFAINQLGDALAGSSTTFASDDDPELIRGAVPFSLKLIESLLAESPEHEGLLLAACSGFTQYSFAFVQEDADELEANNYEAAVALRTRARKLYMRARDYGLRGLEARHPGIEAALRKDPKSAAQGLKRRDVPLAYWTAAAWGSLISLSKDSPEVIADQVIVEALIDRALQLDESFDHGAIHSFLITYEQSRQGAAGDAASRSRQHFERAMELSRGQQAGPLVALAEAVSVKNQNADEFKTLLNRALAINVDARPEWRLVNLVMQRRARWLLNRMDDLFIPALPPADKSK
ncbi:MAG: TRAP transporter TatT component family protein [Verrucomicrobiota bacterium]